MIPRTTFGRLIAAVWLLLCFAVLAFAYVQRGIHDMPIAATWFIVFLSAPLGILVAPLVGVLTSAATHQLGIPYEPFWHFVPSWLGIALAGYVQWFYALPRLYRRFRNAQPGV